MKRPNSAEARSDATICDDESSLFAGRGVGVSALDSAPAEREQLPLWRQATSGVAAVRDGMLRSLNERILFPLRFSYLETRLAPYLAGHRTVLDVGTSCGRLAQRLQNRLGNEFVGVDVTPHPHPVRPSILYDGVTLPFPDDSFDCVMMIDMLHHEEAQGALLAEARRVARQAVFIKDHYWANRLDFQLLKFADFIGNKPYGVALPYRYLTMSGWQALFDAGQLKVERMEQFRYNWVDICPHVIFELRKV